MNVLVKKLLSAAKNIGEEAVAQTIPGGTTIIAGVEKLVDHDNHNNGEAIEQIGLGVVSAVNSLKGEQVVDAALVTAGVLEVQSGLKKIKAGIK